MAAFDSIDMTAPHTLRELGMTSLPPRRDAQPARVVAVTSLILTVLDDLHAADPDTLGGAEADFWACLIEAHADLIRIHAKAREEMGQNAVRILREGAV